MPTHIYNLIDTMKRKEKRKKEKKKRGWKKTTLEDQRV